MAARESGVAKAIVQAIMDFNENLIIYGLSGSHLISEAAKLGLKTKSEVFADRRYFADGSLIPRSHPLALIMDVENSLLQVRQMVQERTVTAITGESVPIKAETICLHGDGPMAISFAQQIHLLLQQLQFDIQTT